MEPFSDEETKLVELVARLLEHELRRRVTSNGHKVHDAANRTVELYEEVVTGELSLMTPERVFGGVTPS